MHTVVRMRTTQTPLKMLRKFVEEPRSVAPLNTADDTPSHFSRTSTYAPKSKLQLLTATAAKIRNDTDFRHIRRLIQHDSVYELFAAWRRAHASVS